MARQAGRPRGPPQADRVFRALADPRRRALLERLLREGELTVQALAAHQGVSQPAISQHLAALREAALVRRRRSGRRVYYAVSPEGLEPLFDWLGQVSGFWPGRMAARATPLPRIEG